MTLYEKMIDEGVLTPMKGMDWLMLEMAIEDVLAGNIEPADIEMCYDLWPEIAHFYKDYPVKLAKLRILLNVLDDNEWKRKEWS